MPPVTKLRILCFGDSLTAGYSRMGTVYHPYHETLQQMIAMAFPEYELDIVEDGVPGDLVTSRGKFLERMQKNFVTPGSSPFDWTIVLGGTNDLALAAEPDEIFDYLKQVWAIPLARGSRVLALTVTEAGAKVGKARMDARRNSLNDQIKAYQHKNFHVFDLHAAVPFWAMTEADRKRYWDDWIHFTPDGYDLIGQRVGIALVSLLVKERTQADTPARQRRVYRDDDRTFEEESGNPDAISRGYVIVRRKDLD